MNDLDRFEIRQREMIAQHTELRALRAFVREVSQQDPAQVPGQRQSNKERAEDLCEQWGITE